MRIIKLSLILLLAFSFSAKAQIWHLDDTDSEDMYIIRPAVIDFYADWCGPCRQLSPMMDRLANEFSGKVDFYKVDADYSNEWFKEVGEGAIPFILFLTDYNERQLKVTSSGATGLPSYAELRNKVSDMLATWNRKHPSSSVTYSTEMVDLGLSVKWASCNLGANRPEQLGGYYAWGEVDIKPFYEECTYKWYKGPFNDAGIIDNYSNYIKKYNDGNYAGSVDNKYRLDLSDDAASVHLGRGWHIPTAENWQELIENCEWEQSKHGGVSGWDVKGPNGNSIFIPAAGGIRRLSRAGVGTSCCYWTSDKDKKWSRESEATMIFINEDGGGLQENGNRTCGLSIRPVHD